MGDVIQFRPKQREPDTLEPALAETLRGSFLELGVNRPDIADAVARETVAAIDDINERFAFSLQVEGTPVTSEHELALVKAAQDRIIKAFTEKNAEICRNVIKRAGQLGFRVAILTVHSAFER